MNATYFLLIVLSLLLLSSAIPVSALSFNFDSQVNVSSNSGDSQQPQMVTSGDDVYLIWRDNTSGSNNILFKKSTNNGTSFASAITLDSGVANSQNPQIAVSGTNVYAAWHEGSSPSTIAFSKSTDSGGFFSAQVILSSSTNTSVLPDVAALSSDVYVVWQQGTEIFFSDSGDSGVTFDAPVLLSGTSSIIPKVSVSGSDAYVVWEESDDIAFMRISNNGDTFGSKNFLSSGSSASLHEIASAGSNVYVTWKNSTDILFASSTNNGDTFIVKDIGDTGGTSTPNPKIAIDGTSVYVVWSADVSGSDDIFIAKSSDSGTTFTTLNLSQNSGESISPQVAADNGYVSVSWRDNTSGNDEILVKSSDNSGVTFDTSQNISSNSGISLEPRISLEEDRVFVAWEDTTPDGGGFDRDVLFVTGTPSPITVSFDKSQYTLNESAQISIVDSLSSGSIDATITSTSDSLGLVLSLSETGVGTGTFTGTLFFADSTLGSAIEAKAGDTITASFSGSSSAATIFPILIEVQKGGTSFTSFDYGDVVNVQVDDKNSNQDPLAAEEIDVTIASTRDTDGITLTLGETGLNTGIFGGSSSTLIFMNGDAFASASQSITINQTDASKNIDPLNFDTSTISIKSTTDSGGISFILTETGVNTGKFQNVLSLTSGPSTPNSSIQVVPEDILSITSGFFTSNALITPISDKAKGGISVNFDSDDTVTVSYLGKSHDVSVKDSSGPGGGGGGLVRPGLVVNALAGISALGGGGSDYSAPTLSLNNLVLNSLIDVPLEVEDMILNHNSKKQIFPMPLDSFEDFDFPLMINDSGYVLGGFENTLSTHSLVTDNTITIQFVLYEATKIQHFSLYMNLRDAKDSISQSDTQILYNDGKPLQVKDPNGFFQKADVIIQEVEDSPKKFVVFNMTFANPMDTSDIIIRAWDPKLNSFDTIIRDAIKVESSSPEFNPLPDMGEEVEIQELRTDVIPKWVKSNAEWWADDQISDELFVEGIQYIINNRIMFAPNHESTSQTQIPKWIKSNAEWWADDQISDDDFVKSMEWLVNNGVIRFD
ncbi:MAG: hypothetical protein K5790_06590 [Nitrosopumilus sp.]|uniref:hypothetical protein n=1 Tax=Nitrosopumilus sp. TaxID=2024843 RepID=UPI00247C325A|nr:hypothetical protein [Nitrosopumilus sp.]MCV0392945.1 hypothetical protein [Nitrosopumilus sp.]